METGVIWPPLSSRRERPDDFEHAKQQRGQSCTTGSLAWAEITKPLAELAGKAHTIDASEALRSN
jgi:hypothetical protein